MKRLALLLLALPLASFAAAPGEDWAPNVTTSAAWVGNASNGAAVWDRIATLRVGADALLSKEYKATSMDTAAITLHFGGEWYPRFSRLSRGLVGGRAGWYHTFGRTDQAFVFSVEGAVDTVFADERERRGTVEGAVLKLSKRFGPAWRGAILQRFDRYEAKRSVFDAGSSETNVEVSYDLMEATRLSLTGIWREGDIVTYAGYTRPDLAAIANDSLELETFDRPMTAYSTEATTLGGRLSLVHATADDTAMVLSYQYTRTDRTGLKFANSVVSVSFIRQF